MVTVQFSKSQFKAIKDHLRPSTEQVAFVFLAHHRDGEEQIIEVVEYLLVPPEHLIFESEWHAEVSEEIQARDIKMAWDKKLALGEIHSHPKSLRDASFSPSDLRGFQDFVPHVWWRLRGGPYIAIVAGKRDFDALAWITDPHGATEVTNLKVEGEELTPTGITIRDIREKQERERLRYSRQETFFGHEGQVKLGKVRVAIVGCGGVGSHVVQQLAYLGVRHFSLIDEDHVSDSNLNRLIGATEKELGQRKVDVLARLITRIQPEAEVNPIPKSLLSVGAFRALQSCDFVFGSVDEDGVRLVLLELCCAYRRPFIDVATDVPDATTFGGRLVFTGIGKGCLVCRKQLDEGDIRRFFASPQQQEEEAKIYGVRRDALGRTGPSVVFLNGILASAAVTEFASDITGGIRQPFPYLVYRGEMGVITRPDEKLQPNCYYCGAIWNGIEKVDVNRYRSRAIHDQALRSQYICRFQIYPLH